MADHNFAKPLLKTSKTPFLSPFGGQASRGGFHLECDMMCHAEPPIVVFTVYYVTKKVRGSMLVQRRLRPGVGAELDW